MNWIAISFASAAPNCIYLIRAEERYGNGDRVFDLTEQERAVAGISRVALAPANFRNPPRRIRLGLEVSF